MEKENLEDAFVVKVWGRRQKADSSLRSE